MAYCISLSMFWFAITSCSTNENRVTYQLGEQGSRTSVANSGTASARDAGMKVGRASALLHFLAQGTFTEHSTRLLLSIPSWHLVSGMRAFDAEDMASSYLWKKQHHTFVAWAVSGTTDVNWVGMPAAFVSVEGLSAQSTMLSFRRYSKAHPPMLVCFVWEGRSKYPMCG